MTVGRRSDEYMDQGMVENRGSGASHPVRVYTRWHQLAVPLGFSLGISMGIFATYQYHLVFGAMGLALLGIVVPPMVAGLGFPTRDSLTIDSQGLQFARRGPVSFAAISGWSAEDYLRLSRRKGPTLVIVAQDAPARRRLHDEFRTGLRLWQTGLAAGASKAGEERFHGGWRGRAVGAAIVALSLAVIVLSLAMREPAYHLVAVGGLGGAFGGVMLAGIRPS
jgi:hypothetical protein